MCQLMGMSANVPTDACFSFTGLVERAGRTDVHKDGWGITFYRGKGTQTFRDLTAGSDCDVAAFLKQQSIKSDVVIGHIRQANVGALVLENTHPFSRELWGETWTFAHNGQLEEIFDKLTLSNRYTPVGTTDSEFIFCWLLGCIAEKFGDQKPQNARVIWDYVYELSHTLHASGVCNFMLSDGHSLVSHCSNNLHWITRRAPFGPALLKDIAVTVDFAEETTPNDVVTVLATEPLTTNETWTKMHPKEMLVWENGEMTIRYVK
ncbi:class II glutamine amidotransferase [Alteromonas sp. LMIT006]|jgi:predicted glutamine amidotransferase|uniref:class II glutamine amidotransferase n=1 Tax=Alteromonadaceae TaxID=72275 RepID=UPI0020CA6D29|nr:class II glutamine amidotransferase [Alteromonas sp. LMIT006]UTP71741.1 class II glutamine amidotransferase [Alteromonas sp. LMIT006]